MKKIFVLSAVNIVDGGPLTILNSFLEAMQEPVFRDWHFVALVNPSIKLRFGRVKRINISAPKKSWLVRLYYEYVVFMKISKILRPEIWFSLHDLTPNVIAKKRFVYCHNPSPFYRPTWLDALLDPKFIIFNKVYKFFYRVNVNQNDAVIVQQNWMKNALASFVKAPIHVTHPKYVYSNHEPIKLDNQGQALFVYPAFPRIFKNHSVIVRALKLMSSAERANLKIIFTMSGSENLYARWLKFSCKNLPEIIFQGRLTYEETQNLYIRASCLLFPSKLETWGLPLTEAKYFHKNIICADLPYARETVGSYSQVSYISAINPEDWAQAIRHFCKSKSVLDNEIVTTDSQVDSIGVAELLKFSLKITPTSI